jgi:hypothetical protein
MVQEDSRLKVSAANPFVSSFKAVHRASDQVPVDSPDRRGEHEKDTMKKFWKLLATHDGD